MSKKRKKKDTGKKRRGRKRSGRLFRGGKEWKARLYLLLTFDTYLTLMREWIRTLGRVRGLSFPFSPLLFLFLLSFPFLCPSFSFLSSSSFPSLPFFVPRTQQSFSQKRKEKRRISFLTRTSSFCFSSLSSLLLSLSHPLSFPPSLPLCPSSLPSLKGW